MEFNVSWGFQYLCSQLPKVEGCFCEKIKVRVTILTLKNMDEFSYPLRIAWNN